MSRKNNLGVLLQPIFLTFLGTFLGIFLRDYFTSQALFELPQWLIVILVTSMILMLAILLFRIQELFDKQKSNLNEIKSTIRGMYPTDADAGMGMILPKIKTCQTLRIVGLGRQDVIEKLNNDVAKEYLHAIEKRIRKDDHLVLKRITGGDINPIFEKHLSKILELSDQNDHEVEIIIQNSLQAYLTYVIVDDSFLIVNISTAVTKKIIDAKLNFYTYNKEIIDGFTDHFEQLWIKDKPITTPNGLQKRITSYRNNITVSREIDSLLSNNYSEVEVKSLLTNLKNLSTLKIIQGADQITNASNEELKNVKEQIRTTSFKYKISRDVNYEYYAELAKLMKRSDPNFLYKCCYNKESFSSNRFKAFEEQGLTEVEYKKMKYYEFQNQFYFNFIIFDDRVALLGFPTSDKNDSMQFSFKITSENPNENKIITSLIKWFDHVLIGKNSESEILDINYLKNLSISNKRE